MCANNKRFSQRFIEIVSIDTSSIIFIYIDKKKTFFFLSSTGYVLTIGYFDTIKTISYYCPFITLRVYNSLHIAAVVRNTFVKTIGDETLDLHSNR